MAITYGVSTLGKPIVIEEGDEQFATWRIAFLVITFLVGFTNIALVSHYFKNSNKKIHFKYMIKQNPWFIYMTYVVHTLIHTFHYVDNIARPVSYFEPKYLYQKYLLSTMEITFFFNFPLTICGVLFMKNLCQRGYVEYSYLTAYICSSFMTIMHYRVESPLLYSPSVNFSIAGEGVAIFSFVIASFMIKQQPGHKYYKLAIIFFPIVLVTFIIFVNMGPLFALTALFLFALVCYKVLSDQEWELLA